METDEWLDLADENDIIVDRRLRSEVYEKHLPYFRAINLFIRNDSDELWIPRRTPQKAIFPSALDFSCAGHVESRHTYDETLRREALEELNIDTDTLPVVTLGKFGGPKDGMWFFSMCYEIRSNQAPRYNPDDFTEFYWLTPTALEKRILAGDRAKSSLLPVVQRFYLK